MAGSHSDGTSVVDNLFRSGGSSDRRIEENSHAEKTPRARRQHRRARALELPRDRLALAVENCRQVSGLSLYRLAERSGIDYAHLWRIEQGEHQNVSREILLLLSIALVVDTAAVDHIVEVANDILDAAGFKLLRAPWESSRSHPPGNTYSKCNPDKMKD